MGAPGATRTPDKQFRKLLLYPPELRRHNYDIKLFISQQQIYKFVTKRVSEPGLLDSLFLHNHMGKNM